MQIPLPFDREPTDLSGIDWEDPISLQQASQMSGLSIHTLQLQIERGLLKAVKPGRDWLTTPFWLQEYLDSRGSSRKGRSRSQRNRLEH